jgi:HEPN domain-containing protein
MILATELTRLARAKLKDAEFLLRGKRYDGAMYLCGYAIEMAFKARICRTLKWGGFPATRGEFEGLQSFRTHDLELLLRLAGREQYIKNSYLAEWHTVVKWDPEVRYQLVGTATEVETRTMIAAVRALLRKI